MATKWTNPQETRSRNKVCTQQESKPSIVALPVDTVQRARFWSAVTVRSDSKKPLCIHGINRTWKQQVTLSKTCHQRYEW